MNVDNQTIIHIKAGSLPPDALLTAILGKKPNAFGFAVQNVHEGKPDLAITHEDGTNLSLDELKKFFANSKEFCRTLYFGNLADQYNPEDIQPFVINDGDDNPFMALYLEGDITGHTDPKDRTEQFNLVNGILIPKILEWCNDFDGDLTKIANKLRGDVFNKDFMTHIGHRAVLHILPVEGDPINLGKNELGTGDTDWGWTSQKHDFDKPVETKKPEPAAAEKPKNRFGFGAAKASVPAVPAKTEVQDAATKGTEDRAKSGNGVGSRPAQKQESGAPVIASRPPSWCHKNDDVKLWYKVVHGETIAAWKKRIPVTVKDFEAVKIDNLVAFKEYAMKQALQTTGGAETSAGKPPAETVAHDKSALPAAEDLPILDAKKLDEVLSYVATLDTSSKEIVPPKDIQNMEAALPKFSTSVGLERMETINWPVHNLVNIGKKDIMALVCYAIEWRSAYRALKTGQPETTSKETSTSKTTTTQTGTAKKVESTSKEAAPKPRFGFGKAA